MPKKKALKFLVNDKQGNPHWRSSALVKRFPRSPLAGLPQKLSSTYAARVESGDLPRGYDRLDKKWKRVAKAVASGDQTVAEVCRKYGIGQDTFYRRRKAHPLFRKYLEKCFHSSVKNVPNVLSRHSVRAAKIIGDALESSDPYFRTDVAQKHLKGMGHYSTKHEVKTDHTGHVQVDGNIERVGLDKEMIGMFVRGLVEISRGKPMDAIDVPAEEVKLLPEKTA